MYTTQDQIESVLQRSLTTQEETIIQEVIESVSNSIEAYTGRRWFSVGETEAAEETRFFDGNGNREIFIDDFISISRVRMLDSLGSVLETLNSSYYILNPRNTTWKNSIYLRDRAFLNIRSGVEITGVFYTGQVPVEVQMAAANMIGLFFSSSRNIGEFKKESIEGYSYEVLIGAEKTLQQQAVFEQIDQWRKVRV